MIYLASPYSDKNMYIRKLRARQVAEFAAKKTLEGLIIYSPIAHSIGLQASDSVRLPGDYGFWQNHCEAMIDLATGFWILKLDGWEDSRGVTAEEKYAKEKGLEIKFKEF